MRERRSGLDPGVRHRLETKVEIRLLASRIWSESASVLVYLATGDEVSTDGIVRDALASGKVLAAPKVTGPGTMEARLLQNWDAIRQGPFGIREPTGDIAGPRFDLVLVPGVAFTPGGGRLGYGRGFYDRFLARCRPRFTIGLAFGVQLTDAFEVEPHDVLMDALIVDGTWVVPRPSRV